MLTLAEDMLREHPSFQKGLEKAQSLWKYGKCPGASSSQLPDGLGLPSSADLEAKVLTGWLLGEGFKGRLLGEQIPGDGGGLTFVGHSGMG